MAKVPDKIANSWGSALPIFVDLPYLANGELLTGNVHPVDYIFDRLGQLGNLAVPVVGLSRETIYQDAIERVVAKYQRGACLRLEYEDFDEEGVLAGLIDEILAKIGLHPEDVDLVVDLKDVATQRVRFLVSAMREVANLLPYLRDWRSFTLAATAFPENLAGYQPGINRRERTEWLAWIEFLQNPGGVERLPSFGDYGINNPTLNEVDPRLIRMSANLRYTAVTEWLLCKGRNVRNYGFDQFNGLCQGLVQLPEYAGTAFSWGDAYIDRCARGVDGPGNATTWRKVGTSHHVALVNDQIANLP